MASVWITVLADDCLLPVIAGAAGHEPLAFTTEHEALSYIRDEPYLAVQEIQLRGVLDNGKPSR